MLAPKDFISKLENDNVKIIEQYEDLVYIIAINNMPSNANLLKSGRREKIYEYKPFILKSCDKEKIGGKKSDYEELRLEVLAALNFKYRIPILQKLAIIHIINSQEYFLVEEFLTPYEGFDDILKDRAKELVNNAAKIFKSGDFIEKNVIYHKDTDSLMFTDVFSTKEHLIKAPDNNL